MRNMKCQWVNRRLNPTIHTLYAGLTCHIFSYSSNQPILTFVWFPLPVGNIGLTHAIPCSAAIISDLKWNVLVPEKWQCIRSLWSNESSDQICFWKWGALYIALVNWIKLHLLLKYLHWYNTLSSTSGMLFTKRVQYQLSLITESYLLIYLRCSK